jgi:hypothetical protein
VSLRPLILSNFNNPATLSASDHTRTLEILAGDSGVEQYNSSRIFLAEAGQM